MGACCGLVGVVGGWVGGWVFEGLAAWRLAALVAAARGGCRLGARGCLVSALGFVVGFRGGATASPQISSGAGGAGAFQTNAAEKIHLAVRVMARSSENLPGELAAGLELASGGSASYSAVWCRAARTGRCARLAL